MSTIEAILVNEGVGQPIFYVVEGDTASTPVMSEDSVNWRMPFSNASPKQLLWHQDAVLSALVAKHRINETSMDLN